MKISCRYSVRCLLAAAMLLVPAASLPAQQAALNTPPAVVVSVASIDEQMADARYVLQASGFGHFVDLVNAGQGFAQGVDTTKPVGAYLTMNGIEPQIVGFVGVTDLDTVMAMVAGQVGPPEDVPGGLKKITAPGSDVFVKEQGGWAFLSNKADLLATIPMDPTTVLGGLQDNYNVAIQVNVQSIPEDLRNMAVMFIKQQFEQSLQRELSDESAELKEIRERASRSMMENLEQAVQQMEQYTVAWGVDDTTQRTFIDITATAIPGSDLANRIARQKTSSNFTGFLLPNAAATVNFAAQLAQPDIDNSLSMIQLMRSQALNELDSDTNLNDEERAAAKEVLSGFIDTIQSTIESGRMDGGATLLLSQTGLTFAAGGHVADGQALENLLRRIAELAKDEKDFPGINFGAESHANVEFHTMRFPMPPGKEEARAVLGDELEVAFGIGQQSAYMAFGRDSVQTLKNIIDQSAAGANQEMPMMQMNVTLAPIMSFAAAFSDDATVAALAQSMSNANGTDRISITGQTIPNGQTSRIELQEGAIRAIGEAIKAGMNQ